VEICLRVLIIVWEKSAASYFRLDRLGFRSFHTLYKMSCDCKRHKTFFGFGPSAKYL